MDAVLDWWVIQYANRQRIVETQIALLQSLSTMNTQFLLVYFTLSGSYMFQMFAVLKQLTTK